METYFVDAEGLITKSKPAQYHLEDVIIAEGKPLPPCRPLPGLKYHAFWGEDNHWACTTDNWIPSKPDEPPSLKKIPAKPHIELVSPSQYELFCPGSWDIEYFKNLIARGCIKVEIHGRDAHIDVMGGRYSFVQEIPARYRYKAVKN